jgi:hypothetical protein
METDERGGEPEMSDDRRAEESDEAVANFINLGLKRPPVPPMPKTRTECVGVMDGKFSVVSTGPTVDTRGSGYGHGGESACMAELQCPFCGFKFKAIERFGCFHGTRKPENCPNCDFPRNILNQFFTLPPEEGDKNQQDPAEAKP